MESIFELLAHPIRRGILRITEAAPNGAAYTQLLTELQISTGRLNYHLRQMSGYVEKNEAFWYALTPLGQKALEILSVVRQGMESDPTLGEYYQPKRERSPLVFLLRSMTCILLIAIAVPIYFIGLDLAEAISSGAAVSYILFTSLALVIGVAVLIWLLIALKYAPRFARKIEERLYD
jgi:hypothetical protein